MKPFLIFLLSALWLSTQAQTNPAATSEREVFTVVQEPPQFPGGMTKYEKYLRQNLRYPEEAKQAKRKGRVFITFIITDQGKVEEVKALNKLGYGLEEEAVRFVSSMPDWIPGKQNGRAVTVRFNVPINFD